MHLYLYTCIHLLIIIRLIFPIFMHKFRFTCVHSLTIIRLIFTLFMHLYLYLHSSIIITFMFIIFMHLYLHMDVFILHPPRPSTKCMSPRRNSWQRSVPAMKCQAKKCPRDEMAGDEVSTRQNGRQRNDGDKKGCTHMY